ncbi:hypothetical protein [Psychrobacter sp. FDAARGOS_221]|uniref:hypothetical protein n=1 Tax=Psychrobacter sp. FDAARGOS_221 TaxID=1975705 RepID=UPI000BB55857|nr:hypothetical protein [Psychrobacter sp. FDAARGOS_221]PNK59584.1 hypothetical protein A6J60_000905 [Psychrobacter sp. FDAARGOS_221]
MNIKHPSSVLKRLTLIAVMLVSAVTVMPALANAAQANNETCDQISELAGLVMMARQEGLSAQEMLQVSSRVLEGYSDDYHHLVGVMVGDAFRVPRYVDDHNKQSEIADFSHQYYQSCQQVFSKR